MTCAPLPAVLVRAKETRGITTAECECHYLRYNPRCEQLQEGWCAAPGHVTLEAACARWEEQSFPAEGEAAAGASQSLNQRRRRRVQGAYGAQAHRFPCNSSGSGGLEV